MAHSSASWAYLSPEPRPVVEVEAILIDDTEITDLAVETVHADGFGSGAVSVIGPIGAAESSCDRVEPVIDLKVVAGAGPGEAPAGCEPDAARVLSVLDVSIAPYVRERSAGRGGAC